MTESRVPAGVPTGGQFAASARGESDVALMDPHRQVAADAPRVRAAIALAKATGKPVLLPVEAATGGYDADEQSVGSGVGGDISLGAEPSNRRTWATGRDDEPFVTCTVTHYVTARRESDDHDLDYDEWTEACKTYQAYIDSDENDWDEYPHIEPIRYAVDNTAEWIAHTDLDDVGGSEVRSEYEPDGGFDPTFSTLAEAESAARNSARGVNWQRDYSPENWTA